ncbi:MAG TPA: O-antigen ligase family protein, partial [Chitinophagaceae bacterium]
AIAFYFQTKNKTYKQLLMVTLAILILATFFAYARGAWVALIMGAIAYWLLRRQILVATYCVAMVLAIVSVFYLKANDRYLVFAHDYETTIFHEDFQEHLVATIKLKDVSSAERFNRWIGGIRMVKDYWATGSGPNTFFPLYKQYTVPAFKTWVSRNEERSTVHNYFLLTIIEQGIIGFILLMFLLGYMFYLAQRLYKIIENRFWKTTIAVVTVILAMVLTVNLLSDLIEADKIGSMFYLCLAVLAIAEIRHRKVSNSTPDIHGIS